MITYAYQQVLTPVLNCIPVPNITTTDKQQTPQTLIHCDPLLYDFLKPTYLYLYKTTLTGIYKFGVAYDLCQRAKNAEQPNRYAELASAHLFDTRFQALAFERALIEINHGKAFQHSGSAIRSALGYSYELTSYNAAEFDTLVESYKLDWIELGHERFLMTHCPHLWAARSSDTHQGALPL